MKTARPSRLRLFAGLAVSLLLLTPAPAAAPLRISSEIDLGADFKGLKTYGFHRYESHPDYGAAKPQAEKVIAMLADGIRAGMKKLGYAEVAPDKADVVLWVRGSSVPDDDSDGRQDGVLVIEAFRGATSRHALWTGRAKGRSEVIPDEARLREAIGQIMANFPAAAK